MTSTLIYFVLAPILIGVFLYLFHLKRATRIIALLSQFVIFFASIFLFIEAKGLSKLGYKGELLGLSGMIYSIGNFHENLGITLVADTLSAVFIMLTAFFFLIAVIYSYNDENSPLFWFLLFLWQSSLMGIFLSSDLFNIFVMIEVGVLVVAILIMFNRKKRSLYDGMIYLMINTIAMQFYLFGVGYVYKYAGTLNLYEVNTVFTQINPEYLVLPYVLIMTFTVLKCALLPLFSWLPKAHGTPGSPGTVSAVLSGLHIKSSIYLFLRFQYVFEGIAITEFFMVLGILTAIFGFIMALGQKDLKLILAYHTISQVGLIFTGLNLGGPYSYLGALYHMFNHAIFKSTLFLASNIIYKYYGTRNVYEIRGVFKTMPTVAVATLLAVFGIMGTPIFNGSISKYFIASGTYGLMNYVLIFMSLGTIISFIKFSTILFGAPKTLPTDTPKKVDLMQQLPIIILGTICFFGGLFGSAFIYFLFDVRLSVNPAGYLEKSFIFFLSLLTGYALYRFYVKKSKLLKKLGTMELGFREMVVSIGTFFIILLVTVGFM